MLAHRRREAANSALTVTLFSWLTLWASRICGNPRRPGAVCRLGLAFGAALLSPGSLTEITERTASAPCTAGRLPRTARPVRALYTASRRDLRGRTPSYCPQDRMARLEPYCPNYEERQTGHEHGVAAALSTERLEPIALTASKPPAVACRSSHLVDFFPVFIASRNCPSI